MCGSPGCSHANPSTRGSASFSDHFPLRFELRCATSIVNDVATHIVQLRSVSSDKAFLGMLSVFVQVRSDRILALIRKSKSSSGVYSRPSFAVSHSEFWSPPIWVRRAVRHLRGSHRIAASASDCCQLVGLFLSGLAPTRATFGICPSRHRSFVLDQSPGPHFSCASLAASTSPKVFIACSPVDFATLGAEGDCQVLCQEDHR